MFEQQKIEIKSGSGDNYFEANASFSTMTNSTELEVIMSGLRKMQKDRMEWASERPVKSKQAFGQRTHPTDPSCGEGELRKSGVFKPPQLGEKGGAN